jgi:hypothetical protein
MRTPLSSRIFALLGALLVVAGVVLALLGSFAFVAVIAIGLFFTAAALVARVAIRSSRDD